MKTKLWIGRIIGALAIIFLLVDGAMKLLKPTIVVEATRQLGYPESTIVGSIALLVSTVLYIIPRT